MIDFLAGLDPANGLARDAALFPPSPPDDLLWRALVRLDRAEVPGADGKALNPRVVGAYGHARQDALVRGVGEAVERYALFPQPEPGAVRGRRAELDARALEFERCALGDPDAVDDLLTWYPARRLRDDATVLVPAPLVDYPTADAGGRFDPGPSGAASGQGYERALRSALLETVERDALLVAWERQLRLWPVDAPGEGPAADGRLRRLWDAARGAGLVPLLADLPTAVDGVTCTVAVVLDAAGRLATMGCNATDDIRWSLLGALQEALQVRSAIVNEREKQGYGTAPAAILDDDDRLRYVASPENYEQVSRWVSGFGRPRPPRHTEPGAAVPAARIVGDMVADGADPLAVDLTHRLPAALRAMGWAVVKVIPAGYQPLRLNETLHFSRLTHRMNTAEDRTGLTAAAGDGPGPGPHPLP